MPRFSLALPGRKFTVAYACVCFRANFCNRREIFKRNFSIKGAKSGCAYARRRGCNAETDIFNHATDLYLYLVYARLELSLP